MCIRDSGSPAHSASRVVLGLLRLCRSRSQSLRTSASVAGQGHRTVGESLPAEVMFFTATVHCAGPRPARLVCVSSLLTAHRPSALLRVHTLNFTSQFQHTRRPRERFSRRVPSDHRMAGQCRGPVKVSVCMKRYTYRAGLMHRGPAAHTCLGGTARNPTLLSPHPLSLIHI